jgi:hypothetical protein
MLLLIMQFSPVSCYFICLGSKYSPQHPVPSAIPYFLFITAVEYGLDCAL